MNKKGFTLVEVLVSFALISVISIFLYQIIVIMKNVYIEKGVKTEMIVEQANISNSINKDILSHDDKGNYIKTINKTSDTTLEIIYSNGDRGKIVVDPNNKSISYNDFNQKFLSDVTISSIIVDYDYDTETELDRDGYFLITIPVSYNKFKFNSDINILMRYDSEKTSIIG